jgi:hypothetical protein
MLANRNWIRRNEPFPHVLADNVFNKATYRRLEWGFHHAVADYFKRHPESFTSKMTADPESPFALFTSRAWHDLLAELMQVNATGDVDAGLHHHDAGADGGYVHNDLNPGFFAGSPAPGRVNLPQPRICNYYHGDAIAGVAPRATVRAVAVLYYLFNPPWSPGDGGETGLYRFYDDPVSEPAAAVPPVNNSLVAFECTPHSYHSFIAGQKSRNSVIMWLHRPLHEAVQRWGEEAIVRWPRAK